MNYLKWDSPRRKDFTPAYRAQSVVILFQSFFAVVIIVVGSGAKLTRRFTSCRLRSQGVGDQRLKGEGAGGEEKGEEEEETDLEVYRQ